VNVSSENKKETEEEKTSRLVEKSAPAPPRMSRVGLEMSKEAPPSSIMVENHLRQQAREKTPPNSLRVEIPHEGIRNILH
jgi:hypothetical protein